MSAELDSIQNGLRLYNNGQYDSSLVIFETISQREQEIICQNITRGLSIFN
jgi:hypothetical protein